MISSLSRKQILRFFVGGAVLSSLSSCSSLTGNGNNLDSETEATIKAMSDKLAAAKTVRVKARRTSTAGYFFDDKVAEQAKVSAAVSRPNQFVASLDTNRGKRTIIHNHDKLLLVDHRAQTHALTTTPADNDTALRSWSETYGYTPPLAELLVNDPGAYLLKGVSKGRYVGSDIIDGEKVERHTFEQPGMSWDLWINSQTYLPKQIQTRYPNGEGGPPLEQTVTIEKWELNVPLSSSEFTISPPKDSLSIEIIPLN